jgi:hypothetical protein
VSQPLVSMVPQRHRADCAAAVTSMFLRISYEEALLALSKESPELIRKGVWFTELQRAAKKMGVRLKLKRRWNPDFDDGIAHVRFSQGGNHVVLLRAGLFFDTNFEVWHPAEYLRARKAKAGSLLVREGVEV